jgi:hypothetical protein
MTVIRLLLLKIFSYLEMSGKTLYHPRLISPCSLSLSLGTLVEDSARNRPVAYASNRSSARFLSVRGSYAEEGWVHNAGKG